MTPLTLLRTLSFSYLRQHPTRTILVVLSIALGVATLVATQALNKGLKGGLREGVNPLADLADLVISNGQSGVDYKLAEQVRRSGIPGVKDAQPLIMWRVSLVSLDNKVVWLFGVDISGEGGGADNFF